MTTDPAQPSVAAGTTSAVVEAASTTTAATPAAQPRKRRRRAPTSGAADDCFACRKLGRPCDRRRPYCSQCLNHQVTCSGYKTQLTWGVGVASRGKLRGQALPIVKTKKGNAEDKADPKRKSSGSSISKVSATSESNKTQGGRRTSHASPPVPNTMNSQTPTPTTFGFVNVDPNVPMESPPPEFSQSHTPEWPQSQPHHSYTHEHTQSIPTSIPIPQPQRRSHARRHTLQPLQMPPPFTPFRLGPMTAHPFTGHADQFEHAVDFSPATPTYQYPMHSFKDNFQSNGMWAGSYTPDMVDSTFHVGSWPSDTVSSSVSSGRSTKDFPDEELIYNDAAQGLPEYGASATPMALVPETGSQENTFFDSNACQDWMNTNSSSFYIPSALTSSYVGNTRELKELIHYYEQVISPVIVAFDGPTNPYREHILRLAHQSEGLQHAIAALAASNLRMRRDHEIVSSAKRHCAIMDGAEDSPHDATVRKSSMAHNILRGTLDSSDTPGQPGGHSKRELYHKGRSIILLNKELQSSMTDDTALATLLVLCLYHICDTGIAKFKTQFAGVKQIMHFRAKKRNCSNQTRWLITMFKWFDAMTATVNNREGQFDGDVGLFDTFDSDEWALENLAGCDSKLFPIISRLGRLNLLSQGKPVDENSGHKPVQMAPRPPARDFYSMSSSPTDTTPLTEDSCQPTSSIFMTEWNSIRQDLFNWSFDPTSVPSSMHSLSPSVDEINTIDLCHISESFRYSALLYTERLAYPSTPPTAPNFQTLVAHAIYHIRAVKSDVFLLWPLFITGSECVDGNDRELVRKRCLDIQKDSGFFNNMSTLSLLMRVWGEDGNGKGGGAVDGVQVKQENTGMESMGPCRMSEEEIKTEGPFMWRKAMGRVDGEYIVI